MIDMTDKDAGSELVATQFQEVRDDDGFSLEELSTAYAELLRRGATPYDEPASADRAPLPDSPIIGGLHPSISPAIGPKSILEAMLFVETPIIVRSPASTSRRSRVCLPAKLTSSSR
jgi:hypothetical protein